MRTSRCLQTRETNDQFTRRHDQVTRRHILEEQEGQLHSCEKKRNVKKKGRGADFMLTYSTIRDDVTADLHTYIMYGKIL
jgi:hypothetical protein